MSLYETVQTRTGEMIAGVSIPGTNAEIGMPEIPFAEVKFDNDSLAAASIVVAGLGAALIANRIKHYREDINSEIYPAGSDMSKINRKYLKGGLVRGIAAGVFSTGLAAGALLDKADAHTEVKNKEIGAMAVVIDGGVYSLAEDIDTDSGEVTRYEATVNELALDRNALSNLEDVDVTFVAAGAGNSSEIMGVVPGNSNGEERGDAKQTVIDNFSDFIATPSNLGSANTGGSNLEAALTLADSQNPDLILVTAGTLENAAQWDGLNEQNGYIKMITIGDTGSEVNLPTGSVEAPVNNTLNEELLGEENVYQATSTQDIEEAVKDIIDSSVITTEQNEYDGYEKLWKIALGGLGALGVYTFIRESGPRPIRTVKRWISTAKRWINNSRNK